MADFPRKITDDPYGAAILIRRLATEQGAAYWRRYLSAFALMGIAAGATSLSAYLLGEAINKAYIDKNIPGIALYSARPTGRAPPSPERPVSAHSGDDRSRKTAVDRVTVSEPGPRFCSE